MRFLSQLLVWPILFFLFLYQHTLSPDHSWLRYFFPHGYCRFHPSCSAYSYECFKRHGFWRGIFFTIWRLLRCQPFSLGGLDPVPPVPVKEKPR